MASSSPLRENSSSKTPGQLLQEAGDVALAPAEPLKTTHLGNGIVLKTEPVEVGFEGLYNNIAVKNENSDDGAPECVVPKRACDPVVKDEHPDSEQTSIKVEASNCVKMETNCDGVNMSEINGLSALQCYTSSDSEPESPKPQSGTREARSAVRSSSSSSSSSSTSSDDDEEIGRIDIEDDCTSHSETESASDRRPLNVNGVPDKTTGAVKKSNKAQQNANPYLNDIRELPPLPDIAQLRIEEPLEFLHIGHVVNILGILVTVESKPGIPAYDLGTVLFSNEDGSPLGFVDDVIGPVRCPIYIVRFASKEDIEAKGVVVGQKIYAAPKSSLTKYVFLQQLLKLKGSDASWVDDLEVPSEFQDFSDDDEEHTTKRVGGGGNGGGGGGVKRHSSSSSSSGSLERHRKFEQSMNMENDVNTRIHRIRDAIVSARRQRGGGAAAAAPGRQRVHSRMHPGRGGDPSLAARFAPAAPVKEVAAFNPAVPPPPVPRALVQPAVLGRPPPPFAPPQPAALAWTGRAPPVVMCNPMVGPAPPPNTMQPAFRLFHANSAAFRPMAPMNPAVHPPNMCGNFGGGGGVSARAGPNYALQPRMGVPPYVRPSRAPPVFPPMSVVGSTNMGTGSGGGRYYENADVAPHVRFLYQSDMWLSNQSPPHQWPYSMPYLSLNMPPPPSLPPPRVAPILQPAPPSAVRPQPRLLLSAPQPLHRRHRLNNNNSNNQSGGGGDNAPSHTGHAAGLSKPNK